MPHPATRCWRSIRAAHPVADSIFPAPFMPTGAISTRRTSAPASAGGCATQVRRNFTNQTINLCAGGSVTITWTITDKCDTTTVDAIYTVTPAPALTFSQPADATVASCTFADQTALNAAIAAWVTHQTTALPAAGGCSPPQ